ncbi:MarR family winged helix-turn-helix transcriptional regulator [Isobaculum melis]|uniref:DNA-binding transcriptional regulator, MarR family n=1 Tax=Isobaculum melis TaxID=142588 RepID=A0A1H9PQQ3_9LACT|nr:MarR family transcriptional regulator [Isobaculum melis]SER49883.1 DNA-binding transcriptional regulator, MarR family [Isobaculum melis]
MKYHTKSSLIWLRMLHFVNYSNRLTNEHLKPYGVTAAKFDALVQIQTHQPITQMKLAEKLLLTQAGISKMLSSLEKEGLVCKKVHWKEKEISLTPAGETFLTKILPTQLDFQSSFFEEVLTESEIKALYQMMTKITKNAHDKIADI